VRSSFVMNQRVCQMGQPESNTMPDGLLPACENRAVQKTVRRLLGIGLLAGVAYAVWRQFPTGHDTRTHWEPQPFPFPPKPSAEVERDASPWVEPAESGACPAHHPVKAKLSSGIFHEPGGANYARTQPDRCYLSADAAQADGLRPSKN
jgi:hypothetical protein